MSVRGHMQVGLTELGSIDHQRFKLTPGGPPPLLQYLFLGYKIIWSSVVIIMQLVKEQLLKAY